MAEQEWVYISHPQVDAIGGPVTRKSFDALWKDKGWSVTTDFELVTNEDGSQKALKRKAAAAAKKEG